MSQTSYFSVFSWYLKKEWFALFAVNLKLPVDGFNASYLAVKNLCCMIHVIQCVGGIDALIKFFFRSDREWLTLKIFKNISQWKYFILCSKHQTYIKHNPQNQWEMFNIRKLSIKHFKTSFRVIWKLPAKLHFSDHFPWFVFRFSTVFTFQWNQINRLAYINKFFDGSCTNVSHKYKNKDGKNVYHAVDFRWIIFMILFFYQ